MAKEKDSDRVLRHPSKATEETVGPARGLAYFWRLWLHNYGVTPQKYIDEVTTYLRDPRNRISANPVKRNSERSNLAHALFDKTLTWKSLLKGVNILRFIRLEWYIVTHRENEEPMIHYADMPIRTIGQHLPVTPLPDAPSDTDYTKLLAAQRKIKILETRINTLEQYITTQGLAVPGAKRKPPNEPPTAKF